MTSKHEMIEYFEKNSDKHKIHYDKETDCLLNKDGSTFMTMNDFINEYKKKNGESFECLYDEDCFCSSVLRCTECGTVIFYKYDEDYEPHFRCPVCTEYITSYEYWTKDQIDKDEEKQKFIQMTIDMDKWEVEAYARQKRRKGKLDSELMIIKKYTKNYMYDIKLMCNDITKSHIKGLMFRIYRYKKEENNCRTIHKIYKIPLGVTSLINMIKLQRHKKKSNKMKGE